MYVSLIIADSLKHIRAIATNIHSIHQSCKDEEDEVIDIQGENETDSDINARLVFEEVNEYLKTLDNKSYAHVFTMVYERYTTKEIADKLNIPWSTAKDLIERVQGIAFDYYNQGRGGRK